jgi:hypothetical protein
MCHHYVVRENARGECNLSQLVAVSRRALSRILKKRGEERGTHRLVPREYHASPVVFGF